jgi:surface antigen
MKNNQGRNQGCLAIVVFCFGVLTGDHDAFAISLADRVEANGTVNVRQTPAGTALGQQTLGSFGVTIGGPTTASLNGTSYTWWNVNFDAGTDGWVADVGLNSVVPSSPTLLSPGSSTPQGPTIPTLTPTMSWNAVTGATGYGLYVYDITASTLVYDNDSVPNSTSLIMPSGILTAAHSYRWNMRASDSAGFSGYSTLLYFQTAAPLQPPTHGIANQVRTDTGMAMPDPAVLPPGVGVYFRVTPTDPQGNTVRMEVEWHQLPATFTGTANLVSSYVSSGSQAVTPTLTGLASGNYGWAYRVVDSQGLASAWVPPNNPDFTVAQPQPPTHDIASQFRADTGTAMTDPASLPGGVGVYFQVTPTDPQGSAVRMEVELHQLPAIFTGTANLVSSYVPSGSHVATPTLTGLAAGNYGWAYRVTDSQGLASAWVPANDPDFTVQAPAPTLSVNPTDISVSASAGATSFDVSNSGSGTLSYNSSVSSDSSWLTITSGGSGGNSGTIIITYPANPGARRSGTIVVTASGASGSPMTLTVTQAASANGSPFQIGSRVIAAPGAGVDGIYVRSSPPALSRLPGSDKDYDQYSGVHGTIIGGPSIGTAGGFTGGWWQISWDAGIDGWSAESVIALAPLAGDVPEPNFTIVYYGPVSGNNSLSANIFVQSGEAPTSTPEAADFSNTALGNCTWYSYGRLLELKYDAAQLNFLHGDAASWAQEAGFNGIPVDTTPTVGAIAQSVSQDHVAVVESVNANSTITVTESSYTTDAGSPWNFEWRHRTCSPLWFDNFIHVARSSSGGGATAPRISGLTISGTTATISTQTQIGYDFVLEFKNSMSDAAWTPIQTNSGNGAMILMSDTVAVGPSRFYRIRVQ